MTAPTNDSTVAKPESTPSADQSVVDQFPALRPLAERVERAKLNQALAEAHAAAATAQLPKFDAAVESDTVTGGDKGTALAGVLAQGPAAGLADDLAEIVL